MHVDYLCTVILIEWFGRVLQENSNTICNINNEKSVYMIEQFVVKIKATV
jgi:hypothetical protein